MPSALRIGVDVGGSKIEAIALDYNGQVLGRNRIPTPVGNYDGTVRAICDLVLGLEQNVDHQATVGIGIPGTISPATGTVKNANSTWLIGKAFGQDLNAALDRPVRLANDADCFAMSEAVDGAGEGTYVVFGAIAGTGVGGGLVIGGQVLTGPNGIAGEWGHNPLPWPLDKELPGRLCYCGKAGCIETWLSGPGLTADYEPSDQKPEEIVQRARDGQEDALSALDRYMDRMARSLATIINAVDPDVIVLGGGMSNISEIYAEVPKRLGAYVFSDRVNTLLHKNHHGDSSGVRGAAWLWPLEETP
jgi:fructokinase